MPAAHKVHDVFTPTTQARLNFIERKSVDDQLVDSLQTPGKQLIVYGESGSGKSTLLLNKLTHLYPGHIVTRCSASTTYDSLIFDAFDQLSKYYIQGKTRAKSGGVTASLAADFYIVKASVDATFSGSSQRDESRVLPPQLTAQRLAEFMGAQGMCWVVEDFHKLNPSEKLPFSQSLKVFCDVSSSYPAVKVIAIGATETARQVVEYDPEMGNRVSEILVPLMTDIEVAAIITNGQRLLNIVFSDLVKPIVQYSVGLPSVCHQLALNVCLEKDVRVTARDRIVFSPEDLPDAVERYVKQFSDSLKAAFDKALMRHKVKKFDNCRLILRALADGPLAGMLYPEILNAIRSVEPTYPPGNLTLYLGQLTQEARGNILRVGGDKRYRFAIPLYHTYAQLVLLERPTGNQEGLEQMVTVSVINNFYTEVTAANAIFGTAFSAKRKE